VTASHAEPPALQAPGTPWRPRLYKALRGKAAPLMIFEDRIIPAASVWTGARVWTSCLRDLGVGAGDRVVLALEPSPAMLMAFVACLWEGATVAMAPAGAEVDALAEQLDARAVIARNGRWSITPDHDGGPQAPDQLRAAVHAPTPEARLLMRTSGTTGTGRWVALSDQNVLSVVDAHSPALGPRGGTVLSVLPWHHAFGLVIDLLPALFSGASVVRDDAGGRDADRVVELCARWGVTSLATVPLTAERLLDVRGGGRLLGTLLGGVVGGAPVTARLAAALRGTNLRVGYGLTEAAPGVCVGNRGEFTPGFIGRPLRCEARADGEGVLHVRGENVCLGYWNENGLELAEAGRWLRTGDIVEPAGPGGADAGWRFLGRADDSFKLDNGRFVEASRLEQAILAAVPWAGEAALRTPEGRTLEVVLVGDDNLSRADHAAVRVALGGLGGRLKSVRRLPATAAPRTGKGALDRRRLAA